MHVRFLRLGQKKEAVLSGQWVQSATAGLVAHRSKVHVRAPSLSSRSLEKFMAVSKDAPEPPGARTHVMQ
jgi:hypothetical protein